MIRVLENATRKARKPHKCWHCYRTIEAGARYGLQTNVCDGEVYTLRWHVDCDECASEYAKVNGIFYDEDGFGPLRDDWIDSGDYRICLNAWRGFYPHVVARMELTDQLYAIKKGSE
jgi:hypothetical protein